MPRATVLTVGDSAARSEREDVSGPEPHRLLREAGFDVLGPRVVPDDRPAIAAALREPASSSTLVVTTGGTGLAARDVTPVATLAPLSRGRSGFLGTCLVVDLAGTPKSVRRGLTALGALLPPLDPGRAPPAGIGVVFSS
jgi:molybdopterin adenylyltransferase